MLTKNHAAALAVLLACGLSSAARADGLDYNFVDLNYSRIVPQDDPDLDTGTGVAVNGSYGLPADFTVVGDVERVTYDFVGAEKGISDVQQSTGIGLGYHYPLLDRLDLEAEVEYSGLREYTDHSSFNGPPFEAHGLDFVVGVRALLTDHLEVHGYLSEGHFNGTDTDTHGINLGLIYNFVSFFGIGVGYHHDIDDIGGNPVQSSSFTSHGTTLFVRFQF